MIEIHSEHSGLVPVDVVGNPECIRIGHSGQFYTFGRSSALQLARAILNNYGEPLVPTLKFGDVWENAKGDQFIILDGYAVRRSDKRPADSTWQITEAFTKGLVKKVAELGEPK